MQLKETLALYLTNSFEFFLFCYVVWWCWFGIINLDAIFITTLPNRSNSFTMIIFQRIGVHDNVSASIWHIWRLQILYKWCLSTNILCTLTHDIPPNSASSTLQPLQFHSLPLFQPPPHFSPCIHQYVFPYFVRFLKIWKSKQCNVNAMHIKILNINLSH